MTRTAEIAAAREADTRIAAAWEQYWTAMAPADQARKDIKSAQKMVAYYGTASREGQRYVERIATLEAKHAELLAAAEHLRVAAIALNKELYKGWSRFFLVQHIHNSMNCSSFRPTTKIGWLPKVSGLTEVEAVSEYGATLCTICFPSAPTELTTKAVDPDLCTGSGKYHSTKYLTGRENSYSSPSGYCPDCLRWNTLTKTGVMRKHKVDETRRSAV